MIAIVAMAVVMAMLVPLTLNAATSITLGGNGTVSFVSGTNVFVSGISVSSGNSTMAEPGEGIVQTNNNEKEYIAPVTITATSGTVYDVTFFNNTGTKVVYKTVRGGDVIVTVSDFSNTLPVIEAGQTLSCKATLSSKASSNKINFVFQEPQQEKPSAAVTSGSSSDNINTVGDGNSTYSGDTALRWTNWSNGTPEPVSLVMMLPNTTTLNTLNIYHFVDAGVNPGPCDFPDEIEVSYLDENGQYVLLFKAKIATTGSGKLTVTGYDITTQHNTISTNIKQNWSDAVRGSNADSDVDVYDMKINGSSVTFGSTYGGATPCTTFTFSKDISTDALMITFAPRLNCKVGDSTTKNCFVGVTEITVAKTTN